MSPLHHFRYEEGDPESDKQDISTLSNENVEFIEDLLDEEFDDEFNEIITAISQVDNSDDTNIPENFSLQSILQNLKYTTVLAESQSKVNEILNNLCLSKLTPFIYKK